MFAFEPESSNFITCTAALAHLGDRVPVFRQAIADNDGRVTIHINTHDGTHSLFEIGEQRFWAGHASKRGETQVSATTIDSFLEQEGLATVDFVKMDIQGAELAALAEARDVLRAGLKTASWLTVDNTGARHKGANGARDMDTPVKVKRRTSANLLMLLARAAFSLLQFATWPILFLSAVIPFLLWLIS